MSYIQYDFHRYTVRPTKQVKNLHLIEDQHIEHGRCHIVIDPEHHHNNPGEKTTESPINNIQQSVSTLLYTLGILDQKKREKWIQFKAPFSKKFFLPFFTK
ncbi:hypothetical protein [Candidatus Neptunichlamydia sp. REUL1]|uniref:hypothetical protein n=1 Tax=Candidatus Neptunichlamydia sp. REUL1 TaxID=3064277 RepID=UPI00292FF7C2|nr:hypothetical protein [Candidatus Neptunochlamydia sp. REUL1]